MKTSKIFSVLILAMAFHAASGQVCSGFHNSIYCRTPGEADYIPSGYSKSVLLDTKKAYQYAMTLAPGRDYIISVCCEPKFKPVKFRIIDISKDTVIYDNSEDDYMESIGFSVTQNPLNIIVEMTVMAKNVKHPKFADETRSCAGLKVMYRIIGRVGFY